MRNPGIAEIFDRFGRGSPRRPAEMAAAAVPRLHRIVVAFGADGRGFRRAKTAGGVDHPTQTTGSASCTARSAPRRRHGRVAHASPEGFRCGAHAVRDPRMNRARRRCGRRRAGTPVVSNPGGAPASTAYSRGQAQCGTGQYVNTQFSLEPPDQGLCVAHGFVVEPINDAFASTTRANALTAVTRSNQFYNSPGDQSRHRGGWRFLSDPKCYWDPVGKALHTSIILKHNWGGRKKEREKKKKEKNGFSTLFFMKRWPTRVPETWGRRGSRQPTPNGDSGLIPGAVCRTG